MTCEAAALGDLADAALLLEQQQRGAFGSQPPHIRPDGKTEEASKFPCNMDLVSCGGAGDLRQTWTVKRILMDEVAGGT